MVNKFKAIALAGAFVMVAAPAFAQVPPVLNPLGLDFDPFHIFTPAPMKKEPMMMKKHHMMHKKMMKKKMMKK